MCHRGDTQYVAAFFCCECLQAPPTIQSRNQDAPVSLTRSLLAGLASISSKTV